MSEPLRIIHGPFGRIALLRLDHSMVVHAHRECHIVFKIGGADIDFGVGNCKYPVTSQSALLINAWEPHFYNYHDDHEQTVLLALYLNPQWLKEVDRRFSQSAHPKFFARPVEVLTPFLIRVRDDVIDALSYYKPPDPEEMESLIAAIFSEIMSLSLPRTHLPFTSPTGDLRYDARIRKVVDRVLSSDNANFDLEEVVACSGLSRTQFFRVFRKSTGLAPATFLNMRRMEEGLRIVADREVPLYQIALDLGFDTAGNFTRFFASWQGVAPSKYRKIVQVL